MTRVLRTTLAVVGGYVAMAGMQTAFVGQAGVGSSAVSPAQTRLRARSFETPDVVPTTTSSSSSSLASIFAGVCLGLAAFFAAPGTASAGDVADIAIPVNGQGKTTTLDKEQLVRGKRLFNQACAYCHVGGGTRTNQNVSLALEELNNALPPRNTVESLVDYMQQPTTYDGLNDISELHPSIKAADLWPMMRSMRTNDLYDISCYILYQTQNIPEKWGGGKIYY